MLVDLEAGTMRMMAGGGQDADVTLDVEHMGTLSVKQAEWLQSGNEVARRRRDLAADSWQVLFALNRQVVLQHERPGKPPSLLLGSSMVPGNDDATTMHLTVLTRSAELADIKVQVVSHEREPVPFESIILHSTLPPEPPAKRPLIVIPHGGPHSVTLTTFYHVHAAFARLGFTVLLVNYRGSNAFGEAGIHALPGHIGDMDVCDVNDAVTDAVERGLAAATKVCVYGGSHGGFLTAQLTAQYPGRYRVACMRNPVIDMTAMVKVTDIPDWTFIEAGLAFDERMIRQYDMTEGDLAALHKASPISRVEAVVAPTLVLIGAQDLRVPPHQGLIWHNVLRERGVETRVKWYPSDNHPLAGVECEADTFVSVCVWMLTHLPGAEA